METNPKEIVAEPKARAAIVRSYMLSTMGATKRSQKLAAYREKRSADRTPEPFDSGLPSAQRFVVQRHHARAKHYDFRLEWQGVLKSWAVPKGPSPNPADKRLAVETEDHPTDYVDFEGVIPEGNYGAGSVIVWDRGSYLPLEDLETGFEKGKLLVELRGYKLKGRWTLVRTKRAPKQWLLIKEQDGYVETHDGEEYPSDSIFSGLEVDALTEPPTALDLLGDCAANASLGEFDLVRAKPMLATAGKPFSRVGWVYELKLDGYRLLASRSGGDVQLISRNGKDLTRVFPEVAAVVGRLPIERFLLDGEVVVHDGKGLPDFGLLQQRGRLTKAHDVARAVVALPAAYYAFDLLALGDYDLRSLALVDRKKVLRELLPHVGPVRFSEHVPENGEALFEQVLEMGLEGMVAKRSDSPYSGKRSEDWIKVAARRRDAFAIVGFTEPKGTQTSFGALLLAERNEAGWVFAGRVGSGFSDATRDELAAMLDAAAAAPAPDSAERIPAAHWLKPIGVAEVEFKERTRAGQLRQPVFVALRADLRPEDCLAPDFIPAADGIESTAEPKAEVTNRDKIFWPGERLTKGDLVEYYDSVSDWFLPYLKDRPLVLTRFPDGIEGKSFYQKDAPVYTPDWIRLEPLYSEGSEREIRYFVVESAAALTYVANMGAIPLHIWLSCVGHLQHPDWCVLDLDPKGAPFADVVEIARALHRLCEEIGLPNFCKTSGSTGLHIFIPLGRLYTYEQSRTLGELLANVIVGQLPDIATVKRSVGDREGKVYVDYLQNGHGRLIVAPFSARPLPAAPVSMPLSWGQVNKRLAIERFNLKTALRVLRGRKQDPWAGALTESADLLGSLERLSALVHNQ